MKIIEPIKTIQWLNLVAEKTQSKSNNDLSKYLKISRQTVSQQKLGQHAQEPLQALRTAEILEIAPIIVIACSCWERTKDETAKAKWRELFLANCGGTFIHCTKPNEE